MTGDITVQINSGEPTVLFRNVGPAGEKIHDYQRPCGTTSLLYTLKLKDAEGKEVGREYQIVLQLICEGRG